MSHRFLRLGSFVLAADAVLLVSASLAIILTNEPDPATRVGRHLWAGALANTTVALLLFILAVGPVRRGERWALWAYGIPLFVYGLPMLVMDATHVEPAGRLGALGPQVLGLGLALIGLTLAGLGRSDRLRG